MFIYRQCTCIGCPKKNGSLFDNLYLSQIWFQFNEILTIYTLMHRCSVHKILQRSKSKCVYCMNFIIPCQKRRYPIILIDVIIWHPSTTNQTCFYQSKKLLHNFSTDISSYDTSIISFIASSVNLSNFHR